MDIGKILVRLLVGGLNVGSNVLCFSLIPSVAPS